MKKPDLYNESHSATYCPEDDKLRLYVGRVPREEYEALRAEGWTSTPKQDCDFAAVWTVDREDTALSYAGEIQDEDTPPTERAADRAERFAGYRDKRTGEALSHADRYDNSPAVHGFQSYARAVKSADRHDRIADRALTQWDKAEYWTSRTAGVIANALHLQSPSVRMGRIKTLEADLRKAEKSWQESTANRQAQFDSLLSVTEHAAGTRDKPKASNSLADVRWELSKIREKDGTPEGEPATPEQIRRAVVISALDSWHNSDREKALAKEAREGTRPAADIAAEWLAGCTRPADWNPEEGTRYTRHLRHRLQYENQMLEAQGGRAASLEMVKGGTWLGGTIAKVNKSAASGRVVSVAVIVPRVEGWAYGTANEPGTPYALATFKTERAKPGSYGKPTPESLAKLAEFEAAKKAAAAKAPKAPSLINPTKEDAERLQACFNAANVARWEREHKCSIETAPSYYKRPEPGTVREMTQAEYSAASKGAYARHETRDICGGGVIASKSWNAKNPPTVCKVRVTGYEPYIVVRITDKPAKALPAAVWTPYTAPSDTAAPVNA
jgi:hypothetical protein